MPSSLPPPLGGPAPAEVPLLRSPLVCVLAQVRFSSVLRIDTKEGAATFQDRVRADYPLFEAVASQQLHVEMAPMGPVMRTVPSTVLRFSDASRAAQLTLATDTVTLEVSSYEGRDRFLARWANLLTRVEEVFAPGLALRLGLRYANRVHDPVALARLPEFIRPNLIGVAQPDLRNFVTQALSEASIQIEEGRLMLRWGVLPPNATIDPTILPPVSSNSWIIDIDAFLEEQRPFSGRELNPLFRRLSERAYAVFRYAITDTGLEFFGA